MVELFLNMLLRQRHQVSSEQIRFHEQSDPAWLPDHSNNIIVFIIFQIVVVFYVAIVLLLIGTNLRASRANRSASGGETSGQQTATRKKHVVEYSEGKAENRLISKQGSASESSFDCEDDDAVEV